MKKAVFWALACAALVLLLITACSVRCQDAGAVPTLTADVTGVVLSKTSRELVLQTTGDDTVGQRTISVENNLADTVSVGDKVRVTTELHANNTESLRTVEVLAAGVLTQEEAAALLPSLVPRDTNPFGRAVKGEEALLPAAETAPADSSDSEKTIPEQT